MLWLLPILPWWRRPLRDVRRFSFLSRTVWRSGYSIVWAPAVLADVALPDHSNAAGLRNEAAISDGRLFVATTGGHVYMLAP